MSNKNLILTGSSGFVGSRLFDLLKNQFEIIAIDRNPSKTTTIVSDIGVNLPSLKDLPSEEIVVIHCAAARFDYGISAEHYYEDNVNATKSFLLSLEGLNISQFIHISSVAAIDGRNIAYNTSLNCDDAYRCTKFIQQQKVIEWCNKRNIPLDILYPSAIYSDLPRDDTNIGKLQKLANIFPIAPRINVIKSLTNLNKFSYFIGYLIGNPKKQHHLTIEIPAKTVTEIIKDSKNSKLYTFYVPRLDILLMGISYFLLYISKLFNREPIITPSRVKKLFSDTSYKAHYNKFCMNYYKDIDYETNSINRIK